MGFSVLVFYHLVYVMHTSINNNFDAQLVQHQRNLSQNKNPRKTTIQCKSQAFLFISHNYFVSVHACTLSLRKKVSGQQCLQPVHGFESNNKVSAG